VPDWKWWDWQSHFNSSLFISLFFILFSKACGFSFPSFETGNEALEKIKEAGREIIAKASKNVEEIQETVEEKLQPTEKVKKMWKEIEEKIEEKVNNQKEEWKERKKQMKEMYKELKNKAGENKDELVKMWKENKGTWRQQAEEVSVALCFFNEATSRFTYLKNFSLNFSSLTFLIRVNLLRP